MNISDNCSKNQNNFILGSVGAILLILFAVILTPKLPSSISESFENRYFKIIFLLTILVISTKHLGLSIISLFIFFIVINAIKKEEPDSIDNTIIDTNEMFKDNAEDNAEDKIYENEEKLKENDDTFNNEDNIEINPTNTIIDTNEMFNDNTEDNTYDNTEDNTEDNTYDYTEDKIYENEEKLVENYETFNNEDNIEINPTITDEVQEEETITNFPIITIEDATNNATSMEMRNNVIEGSALNINSNTTTETASTILSMKPKTNDVISMIKENFTDYVKESIINENNMRTQSTLAPNQNISKQLVNSADKLVLIRDTVASILNNNNLPINTQLLNSLIESELLNSASKEALKLGHILTAEQLKDASSSYSNIANALVQTNTLNTIAKNSFDPSTIANIAQNHMASSLNMINYNNNIEAALDAYFHNDYELGKKYELQAQQYLQNNITINDNIDLKKLSGQVPDLSTIYNNSVPSNYPPNSNCDNIKPVKMSGWVW